MSFKEDAIKIVKDYIAKREPNVKITEVSEVCETCCEWCDNKTNAVHIGLSTDRDGIAKQMTIFEDPSFRLQSEWWVCGKCEDS